METFLEVVVPAFNEEARVAKTLRALTTYLAAQPFSTAVTVVENGCVDRTTDLIRAVAQESPIPLRVIGCVTPGKGAAVRRGVLASRGSVVGYHDADLATPLEALEPTLRAIADGAHIAVASRRCPGARIVDPPTPLRRVGGALFHLAANKVVQGIRDTQCGFKFMDGGVARELFAELVTDGFAFDVELLARAQAQGMRIVEIPVSWTPMDGSTFSVTKHGKRAGTDLFRVWRLASTGGLG